MRRGRDCRGVARKLRCKPDQRAARTLFAMGVEQFRQTGRIEMGGRGRTPHARAMRLPRPCRPGRWRPPSGNGPMTRLATLRACSFAVDRQHALSCAMLSLFLFLLWEMETQMVGVSPDPTRRIQPAGQPAGCHFLVRAARILKHHAYQNYD